MDGDTWATGLRLDLPALVTLRPGSSERVQFRVLNAGDIVERSYLQVLPAERAGWFTLDRYEVTLRPAESTVVDVVVAPPFDATTGRVEFTVRLVSDPYGYATATTGTLELLDADQDTTVTAPQEKPRPTRWRRIRRLLGHREPAALSRPANPALRLLSDHPITAGEDVLAFGPIAVALARAVLRPSTSTPFTVGVQGGWGTGKSSLMGLVREEIDRRAAADGLPVRTVWYNAWTSEGASALVGLVRTVLPELDGSVLRRMVRRGRDSAWLRVGFLLVSGWLGLGGLADAVWRRFGVDSHSRNEIRERLRAAMDDWVRRGERLGEHRLLVVFVDDLDRCSPANVVEVFEAMKVYLDAPGLVFVIGYDPAIITDAVLTGRQFAMPATGGSYLEKIIQVDYRLPRPDAAQARRLAFAGVHESGAQYLLGDAEIEVAVERSQRNPRRFKRFLNAYVLARQLDDDADRFQPAEHLGLLLLQVYFPRFYDLVLDDASDDPFAQVLDLARLRSGVRSGDPAAPDLAAGLCERLQLVAPGGEETAAAATTRIFEAVPPVVAELAADPEFLTLAWRFGESEQRRDLLTRVRTRPPSLDMLPPSPMTLMCPACATLNPEGSPACIRCRYPLGAPGAAGSFPLEPIPSMTGQLPGRTVVWYDRAGRTRTEATELSSAGALVTVVDTLRGVQQALGPHVTAVIHVLGERESVGEGSPLAETVAAMLGVPNPSVPVFAWGQYPRVGLKGLDTLGARYAGSDTFSLIARLASLPHHP